MCQCGVCGLWLRKRRLSTLIRWNAVGQCDGKSLVHISMRPERRQPAPDWFENQDQAGSSAGIITLVQDALANNAGRTRGIQDATGEACGDPCPMIAISPPFAQQRPALAFHSAGQLSSLPVRFQPCVKARSQPQPTDNG